MAWQYVPQGLAPESLGFQAEPVFLWVEESPGAMYFYPAPWGFLEATVPFGANDRLATAEIRVALARDPSLPAPTTEPRDWQLWDGRSARLVNPWEVLGAGRRIQLRTARPQPADDWCIYEGFVEQVRLGWSGSSRQQVRWLALSTISSIVIADRENGQFIYGQWRRTREGHWSLYGMGEPSEERNRAVMLTGLPCIFNPAGRGNCDPTPLELGEGDESTKVHVFCDVDFPGAKKWSVARILRYLQWAGVQPKPPLTPADENPYDVVWNGSLLPLADRQWTTWNLGHVKNWTSGQTGPQGWAAGPNLSELVEPYLDRTDRGDPDSPRELALLRKPPDAAIHRMSVLEAFAFVADLSGLIFHVEHDVDTAGEVHTYLRWTVRGDRSDAYEAAPVETVPYGRGGGGNLDRGNPVEGSGRGPSARGVYIHVRSDQADISGLQVPQLFAGDAQTEGQLTLDEANVRRLTAIYGDPTQYEIGTGALLPGWRPDEWWDLLVIDDEEVAAAWARAQADAWTNRYGPHTRGFEYANVGRLWILNEDGGCDPSIYRRGVGPWGAEETWHPFGFASQAAVKDLTQRGDNGWSLRRRRFLSTRAKHGEQRLGVLTDLSFDGGTTWWSAEDLGVTVQPCTDRCGVYIRNPDLRLICPPGGEDNYVLAYLKGLLRVAVHANIEGDDGFTAWSWPDGDQQQWLNWAELVDRTGKFGRVLRHVPGNPGLPAANSLLIGNEHVTGGNLNPQPEGERMAARMRDDLQFARWSGQCVVPWLVRNGYGPVTGYRIGDELLGIKTGDAATFVDFLAGRPPSAPAPRIIGMIWRYTARGEQSTALQIEDHSIGVDDLVGSPDVGEEEA